MPLRPFDRAKDTIIREVVDATKQYVGYATPASSAATSAAVWKICKITSAGGEVTNVQWVSRKYDQIWDNRAALTYT